MDGRLTKALSLLSLGRAFLPIGVYDIMSLLHALVALAKNKTESAQKR